MTGEKAKHFKKVFDFNGRNPDVLNSIANLSNDEVFTPPEFANQMLDTLEKAWADSNDGEIIWKNSEIRFLDPSTKSGVFLREIASRLIDGLEDEFPDLQDRVDHILTKQVFGIATTRLTALMARRTLYCSKQANGKYSITNKFNDESGNIWFEPLEHSWVGGKIKEISMDDQGNEIEITKDGRCKYCSAPKVQFGNDGVELHAYGLLHKENPKDWVGKIFGEEMKFDVIIGNPPYQMNDGGGSGSSATPIYQKFVEQAAKLEPRFLSMVIPSKWYSGGKGMDNFRATMLGGRKLISLVDYPDSRDAFQGVDVAGGVCYFLMDPLGHHEKSQVVSVQNGEKTSAMRVLDEYPVFVRSNEALSIINKVSSKNLKSLEKIVSFRRPFDLDSSFKGSPTGELVLYSSHGNSYVDRSQIKKGVELIDAWKVLVSKTASEHAGQSDRQGMRRVLSRLEVMPPGSVATESYLIVGPFPNRSQAERMRDYLSSRFTRYLLSSILLTQNITKSLFAFIPSLDELDDVSDQSLYEKFELTEKEVAHIEAVIKEHRS